MKKTKKLVIVGDGEFGEIAYEYFTYDSEYEVVAFAVEKAYRTKDTLFGLPVVNVEDMEKVYSPKDYQIYVAITYVKLNRVRRRLFDICKKKGYTGASYVSSRSFVWHNVEIGENTFIMEDNNIQYHAKIDDNVVLWGGNYIAHRTVIEDDCWIAPRVAIAGFCHIGRGSFIGVNATIGDNVILGRDTVIGAGSVTVKSLLEKGCVYVGNPARKLDRTAYQQFGLEEE